METVATPTPPAGNGVRQATAAADQGANPVHSPLVLIAAELEDLAAVAQMAADRIATVDRPIEGALNVIAARLEALADALETVDMNPAGGAA